MGKFISLFLIYFFSILFLNYKIICDAYLPSTLSSLVSNENYYFESGTNYNFAVGAASNLINISISCNETLSKTTKVLGVLNFINCSNIVINASSCGSKLQFTPQSTIEQESDISFVSVVFLLTADIESFDSSVQLLDCDISQLDVSGNFIDGHDSHFFIKSLNTLNYTSFPNFYFDSEDNPNSSLTLDSCDGSFNLIVDAVQIALIDCAPLEMTIQNTNLSLNSSYIQINDLNLVNSYFEMINSSLKNLILSGNSSISGDTLNISESLSFVGDNSQLKVINASVYFNGTSFSSDETSVQIQKNFSIFSTTCTVQSTNLYLIVNNTNLQINYSISIKRIDFIGDTLLHGSAILQVSNQIFFNESGIKTIYSPLNILNLINSITYSGNDNFIYLYNDFFIDTSLTSIQLPGIYSENNESILGLYSDTINTNYSIPFLEINGGNISGNNNFLIVEDNISFNGNSLIINNIRIDSQKTNFIENGIIQFQNSYLYSKSSKFQQDSNFTIFGNGLFFSQELNDEGILIIDNIFGGKNIQIQENGDLKLSNINSSNFQNSNVVLNGSLTIENSIISDPFDSLISNSANQFPLIIINSQISFSNNQFDFPSLQMINSSLTNLNSSLKDLFLEGNNALNISDITFQNGMIQMKENSNSFLDISSTNIKFGSYSGLELTSNSTLTIFSSDNSFLNFSFYDENNLTFSIPNDSLLKLENINIDIDGNSITDLSGNISVNQSILRIYNFQNGFIGVLNVIDSNSEVKLESDINIKILNLFKGKLSFTKISTTDNDSYLIFGDGTDQAIINEDSISESIIYSTTGGIIEINNNSIFDNVLFDIRNDSHLIIKTLNLTNSRYASKIKNQGYITINPYYVSLNNPKKDENCFEEELNYIYFNFSVINEENGIINCSENTQFNQLFSSSGLIQTSKNLVFENGLILNETGKIEVLESLQQNISIFGNLEIYGNSEIKFANISVNDSIIISNPSDFTNISNSSLTSKSFVCNSESEISLSNSTFNTQEFLNNGTFLIDSSIFSSSINGYNYGNFSVNNSDVFFQKLESYGDFQFNNSNLTLNDNSFLNNTNNIFGISYFINSIIEIIDEKLLSFNGNYMIEDGGSILGEFKIEENSNITLLLEENNNTYLSINHQPQIQGKLYLNLLRYSEDQPRYYPYKAIYLLNSFNFSSEQLESSDEQFIEINQNENWIIAQVKGCKKGKYSNDFDQECKDCSEGEYNNETGATSCKKCPSGYISNQKGKEECEPCNEGYYQPNTGQSFCFECQPGTHAPHNGSDHCQECPGGEYNYNNASTTCEVCGAGNYSDNPTKCDFCPLGKYNPKEGSTLCYNCSIGTYSNQKGKTFCKACDVDTYQDEIGKESCKVCPENSETNGYGATSINDCVCSLGYYGIASKLCEVCPEGSLCNDIGIVIPYAKEGYWHSKADPTNYLECAVKEACPGGGTDICNKNIGYSGNLCAVCLKGFYKFGSQCMKCPNNQKNRLILVGLFIILLCLFLFIIARKIRNYFASFSIMFSFFQVLAVISGLKLNWPGSLETTWRSISLFNFNIDYLAVECSLQLSYTQKWILCMLFPFIILAVLLIVYLIAFLHSKLIEKCGAGFMRKFPRFCSKPTRKTTNKYIYPFSWIKFKISQIFTHGFSKQKRKTLYNNLINSYTTILSFIYLFISFKALQIFDCKKQTSGVYTFEGDPSLFCYEKWWKDLLPWAIVCLIVYVIGIPVIFIILFFVSSKKLDEKTFDLRFGLLCSRYTKRWFFWEIFIMIRKLFLIISQLFISFDSIFQSVICVIVLLCALVFQVNSKPFVSDRHNKLEFVLICFSEIILFSGMIFASNDLERTSGRGILATAIIAIIWISFSILIIMILYEIRHRVRVKKGKEIDEIKKSDSISSGQSILKFLDSKPSFLLLWNWILESSEHKNKLQKEFFQQIKDFYNSNQTYQQKLNIDEFWESFLTKWKDSFYPIIQLWFLQASIQEKIQFMRILSKIHFESFLYLKSNSTKKERRKTRRLSIQYFKQNLLFIPQTNAN